MARSACLLALLLSVQRAGSQVASESAAAGASAAKPAEEVIMMDAFSVEAESVKGSAADLKNTRIQSDVAIDFLSSEEFSKFGAGDIAESLIRIPGVSVANGQFAVIRGLSDRYTNTTLNGLKIPSPDPEKQSPQMDILPTSLIDSVVVSKTFAPQLWADTSGGGIDLSSKSFPEGQQITVSYGIKVNENALDGGPGYNVPDSGNDWLAQGTHSRPKPTPTSSGPGTNWSEPVDIALQHTDLPIGQKVTLGYGETFLFGDTKKLGVNVSGTYETSSRARSGDKQSLFLENAASPAVSEYNSGTPTQLDGGTYSYDESEVEVSTGALANVGFEFNPEHKLRATVFWTRSGIDTAQANRNPLGLFTDALGDTYVVGIDQGESDAAYSDGFVPQANQKFKDTQRYVERSLSVNQIAGEHTFTDLSDLKFNWAMQSASTYQDDRSVEATYYEQLSSNPSGFSEDFNITPGNIGIAPSGRNGLSRFWSRTEEEQVADRYDFVLPKDVFEGRESKFKFGVAREDTDRTYEGKTDTYTTYVGLSDAERQTSTGDLDSIFNDLIDSNFFNTPNFTTQSRNITAGYLGAELALPGKIQLLGGARLEKFEVATAGRDKVENFSTGAFYHVAASNLLGTEFIPAYASDATAASAHVTTIEFEEEAWYPAIGLVYSPTKRVNFRLNFSQTSGRPSLRELGPYYSRSLDTGDYVVGNPALTPADVDNYDARFEWFGEAGTMTAVSLFGKTIQNPIEKVYLPGFLSGQSVETWVNNPNEATMLGAEFEFRANLSLLDEALRMFSFGGNLTYIHAEVEEHPFVVDQLRNNGHIGANETVTRRLFDQPEYLANFDLSWNQDRWGTTATLAVNFVSDVLYASGGGVLGASESSYDIYTRAYQRLDLFVTQRLAEGWKLRVGVKNLTDPQRGTIYDPEKTAGTIIRNEYRAGREYSVSVSATF